MKKYFQFIEPLEARVAPAVLVSGGNLLGGTGNPTTGETSTGGNTQTLVKVLHGQALVFFDSTTHEITGISVGKHTQLDITGNVYGDIVTNLLPSGRLTDSDNNAANGEDGGILLGINIKGITTHALGTETGDINRIISGGNVNNVNISGQIKGIYAGDGIFRDGPTAVVSTGTVDYNSVKTDLQDQFVLTQAAALPSASASITKVVVQTANQLQIFAGNGQTDGNGAGQPGGSITNVTITSTLTGQGTTPALFLHSGNGGDGSSGGVGGSITNFDDMGSIAYVKVQTGDGGAGSSGHGGAGGALTASAITTSSPRYDLFMGYGGTGATGGGVGGYISGLNFTNNVNGGKSLVATGDFNNDGVQDVLLVNTLTGEGTLSLGHTNPDGTTSFTVAMQTAAGAGGAAISTPFIASEGAVPTSLVAADLNGDGTLDFVVSYASTNNLGVFLGKGDGTFTASAVALPASPTKIVVADFVGTTAPDIAVLSSGNITSTSGGTNSQLFLVQNDGAAHFTALANPTTIGGIGTDLATAQIDNAGGNDLFVGLSSGLIDSFLDNGTGFNLNATITAFNAPITTLDVGTSGGGTTMLLAFTANANANDPSLTTVAPKVDVLTVNTTGASLGQIPFTPGEVGAVNAHFIKGTDVIGVVSPTTLSFYEYQASGYASVATVSSDGVLNDFTTATGSAGYQIVAVGAATNRFFYTSGDPSGQSGLPAFTAVNTPFEPRIISFVGGDGGHAGSGLGGAGGGVASLTYQQNLGGGVEQAGGTYLTNVTTGSGGDSDGGIGGHAGDLLKISLSLNAGYQNDDQDDTTSAFLTTGHGGAGTDGGAGGSISKVTSVSVFNQVIGTMPVPGAVTMQMTAGDGGVGTTGAGGAGGSITLDGAKSLSGLTYFDASATHPEAQALQVLAGNGGDGVTSGGAGGTLTNVGAQNAQFSGGVLNFNELTSALVVSGDGGNATAGNGGGGGAVTGLSLAAQSVVTKIPGTQNNEFLGGSVTVVSGAGGDGAGGVGGNAGSVSKSTVASLTGDPALGFGVLVAGGVGGNGDFGGGKGGGIKTVTMNTASTNDAFAAVLVGGQGGAATVSGEGGRGGTIKGITQSKDVNSNINTIQAGDGGASANGEGGAGGSVKSITTAGFIGLPSVTTGTDGVYLGVFDDAISSPLIASLFATGTSVPQGIFAGRGSDGASNGSVLDVVARQIAAIGATVDANGLFAPAKLVDNISADLIGYDAGQDGGFTSTQTGKVSPATARPVDGFLFADTIGTITITSGDNTRTPLFEFMG